MSIDYLLYFSVFSFVIAIIGFIGELVYGSPKNTENVSKKYKLKTSNVQFCREVVRWSGPILSAHGIKYFPSIELRYNKGVKKMGTYQCSTKTITVYLKSNRNIAEMCSTILHEIKHHIQSEKDPEFKKLTNYSKYGYYKNRIEIEARAFAQAYYERCLEDLCKKRCLIKL